MKRKLLNYVLVAFLILNALLIAVACSDASKKGECEHEFDEWSAIRKRTCTQEQVEVRRCELCGKREKKRTGMISHEPGIIMGKEPTCLEEGLSNGESCVLCGKILKEQVILPMADHTPVYHEPKAPSCTEMGHSSYSTCSYCNATLEWGEAIPMLDHVEKVIPGQSHNCMEKGMLDGVECDICHTVLVEPAIGYGKHEYKNGECVHCHETESVSEGFLFSFNSHYEGYMLDSIGDCKDENIVIPRLYKGYPVVIINQTAFINNQNIKSVVIPDSVREIGFLAFSDCTNLKSVKMGNGVQYLGGSVFRSCASLEEVQLSERLISIGSSAFKDCKSLESITIGCDDDSIELVIDSYIFSGCTALTNVIFKRSVHTIYRSAFFDCSALNYVTFDGTIKEWKTVGFLDRWLSGSNVSKVICTDGEVSVN